MLQVRRGIANAPWTQAPVARRDDYERAGDGTRTTHGMCSRSLPALVLLLTASTAAASPSPHKFGLEANCPDAVLRFDARQFGAKGDGHTNDGPAIQEAIDRASATGGCAVVSRGIFLSGGLLMKPHATLFLDITASLRASTNGSDWLPQYAGVAARSAKGIYCSTAGHLIGGIAAHNSKIVGEGVLDAQCQQYITGIGGHVDNAQDGGGPDELSYRTLAVPGHGNIRVGVLALSNSVNVTVGGIQLANSHAWTSAYYNCSNLLISGVKIYGDWRMPNNDGIDICSCTNTTVEDVDVDTGDDCISPKSNVGEILPGGKPTGGIIPLRGLTVRNARLRSRSFAVKFGTETHGDMSEIYFDRLQIYSSHHGIGIDWRGAGHFHNATFNNINVLRADWVGTGSFMSQNWMGAAQPFSITNKGGGLLNPGEKVGVVSDIVIENLSSVSENGIFISGVGGDDPAGGIHNISLVNVHALIQQLPSNNATNGPHTAHDDTTGGRIAAPVDAFYVEFASGVTFTDCSAAFDGNPTVGNNFGRCVRLVRPLNKEMLTVLTNACFQLYVPYWLTQQMDTAGQWHRGVSHPEARGLCGATTVHLQLLQVQLDHTSACRVWTDCTRSGPPLWPNLWCGTAFSFHIDQTCCTACFVEHCRSLSEKRGHLCAWQARTDAGQIDFVARETSRAPLYATARSLREGSPVPSGVHVFLKEPPGKYNRLVFSAIGLGQIIMSHRKFAVQCIC